LLDICQQSDFEGDAAMQLEFAVDETSTSESYPFTIDADGIIDWEPMLHSILRDRQDRLSVSQIATRFHLTLVEMMLATAHRLGERRVVLSGGCFQNKFLTEQAIQRLQGNGFDVYWPQQVPPNDGGIALGQIIASIRT
jgi:hydrogenase maturation protein HypF